MHWKERLASNTVAIDAFKHSSTINVFIKYVLFQA